MLRLLIVIGRALAQGLRGQRELVLENLALRQHLTAMKRADRRPRLLARDRLFWIALTRIWELAHGGGPGAARHRRAMASRLGSATDGPYVRHADEPTVRPSVGRFARSSVK